MFHYPGIKFNQKTRFGQKVGNFILWWGEHPLQCCVTPNIHRSCEINFQISNLLQTSIIAWITHPRWMCPNK
jgi:hypothetical protein